MSSLTASLPKTTEELLAWTWPEMKPLYDDLAARKLDARTAADWLADWSRLSECVSELRSRREVGTTLDTSDHDAEHAYADFLDEIFPHAEAAEQRMKEKLLASGVEPEGYETALRSLRAEAGLFRKENLPLLAEERKLCTEHDRIIGSQTAKWDGQDRTLAQIERAYRDPDRARRESAFRTAMGRRLEDRGALNDLWGRFLGVRRRLAENADLTDFRAYSWVRRLRFDYGPEDSLAFHRAIEEVVVPAASRALERRRKRLGVDTLRPWDVDVDPSGLPPLAPFKTVDELVWKSDAIFERLDPDLAKYFRVMRDEGLLDLGERKNKAPGGYCESFDYIRKPFIFMKAVGIHDDVQTLLHEAGHAFHTFEAARLPYVDQRHTTEEFGEVASMSMELLSAPHFADPDGFYDEKQAARARIEHLEGILLFLPYMAVVDGFQHWVYTHPDEAADPARCDETWQALFHRMRPGIDWSGLDEVLATGWHRKLHIHVAPFYYVEYGMAQLGAIQVWARSLEDPKGAVAAYRKALALGATRPLPELYAACGARFAFDAKTIGDCIRLVEQEIEKLLRA